MPIYSLGRIPNSTVIVMDEPSRSTVKVIVVPGEYCTKRSCSGCASSIAVSLTAVMMSPLLSPAASAGLPEMIGDVAPSATIHAPALTGRLFSRATRRSSAVYRTPIHGRDNGTPASACSRIGRAMSIGIANPIPAPSVEMAVLMPITAPLESTSAPPEFPGLIAASV